MTAPDIRTRDPDDIALEWFAQLYRDIDRGWCTIFSIDTQGARHVDWHAWDYPDELAVAAIDRAADSNVWFGVATRREQLDGNRRGGDQDCDQLTALWADIDVAGPNHADNTGLPASFEQAWQLIRTFPLVATAIINSGGGLQAWWFLTEPIDAATAAPLLRRWEATWKQKAAEQHLHIDSVFDLARVMRVPGTTNRKTIPTPVIILDADWDRRYGLDDLDPWLTDPPPPTEPGAARHDYIGPERPGDAYNVRHSGAEVLAELGFTFARKDRNSDEHWVRPGKEKRDGTSATIYAEDGHITIWSDTAVHMWPALELRRPYDPYGLLVATKYAGDFTRASSELRARGYGDNQPPDITWATNEPATTTPDQPATEPSPTLTHGWERTDLTLLVATDYQPPTPTLLQRTDHTGLFYPGRVNALIGESGCGKSFGAQLAVIQQLAAGNHVIYIDLEDHAASLTARLTNDFNIDPDVVLALFHYIQPELAYNTAASEHVEQLVNDLPVHLIIIDSVGEAMALQGQKQNDDDEVARWNRMLPRRLATLGPAVALIDHVPKAKDAPAGYAIGSQRKKAAIDGAGYRVEQVKAFGRGRHGIAKLTTTKDRNGTHPTGFSVGELHLDATTTPSTMTLHAPVGQSGAPFRPTVLMERISLYLEGRPAQSKRSIIDGTRGNANHLATALTVLVDEGFVARHEKGNAAFHWSEKPYRETDDTTTNEPPATPETTTEGDSEPF